jgi:hypothetical protein
MNFNKNIAICLNCYYKSDISKLILQLSSLLFKFKNKDRTKILEILNSKIKFQTIDECINYLKLNFKEIEIIENSKIHVALYCDGLSGYVYKNNEDFKKRIDILEFEEIFKNVVFKIGNKNSVNYIRLNQNINVNLNQNVDSNINSNQKQNINSNQNQHFITLYLS